MEEAVRKEGIRRGGNVAGGNGGMRVRGGSVEQIVR